MAVSRRSRTVISGTRRVVVRSPGANRIWPCGAVRGKNGLGLNIPSTQPSIMAMLSWRLRSILVVALALSVGSAMSLSIAEHPAARAEARKPDKTAGKSSGKPDRTAANKNAGRSSDRPTLGPRKSVAGGTHWRITSENGPIHVWIPPGYKKLKSKKTGLVIYVHGYHNDADSAWKKHKLAQQFRRSRQNAMFLVIEAPRSNDDRIYWDSLAALKKTVSLAGVRLPDGPAIAIAHSGGFRTLAHWVDNRLLAQVILLDALYGRQKQFDEFIAGEHGDKRKMVIVAAGDTAKNSAAFAKKFPYAVVRDRLPGSYKAMSRAEKGTRLLYIHSRVGHNALVTGGEVIPLILRITPLERY